MNKIVIVRHGESIGNAKNIIQGRNSDYGLTEKGEKALQKKFHDEIDTFKDVDKIITSPSKRTIETASILLKEIGKPIPMYFNSNIEELDAGILSGQNKEEAGNIYPQYYQIWKNREDLDEIPEAESGEDLQARVIGFLMQYYDNPHYNDVIVTHAGFIRCLINTIENRERTQKFNIENGAIFPIEDIFKNMDIEIKARAMSSKVFIVNTVNGKYVVKLKTGKIKNQDYAEQELLQGLKGSKWPKILSIQGYADNRYCKIIKFVSGKHVYGRLTDEEFNAIIEAEEELRSVLSSIKDEKFPTKNLKSRLENIYKEAPNKYIKSIARELLESKYSASFADNENFVLSHNDLNRDNILFEQTEQEQVKANIIDFEALEYAPQDYQFASMLASGLLLEGESMEKIKQTIREKGKDIGKILYFMQIRVLEGLHFFSDPTNPYVSSNKKVAKDLLKRYFFTSEKIQREIDKINERKEEERTI